MGSLVIGSDALGGQGVVPTETDFVSIASNSDIDFYSFAISAPAMLSASVTPLGGVFSQGLEGGTQSTFNANARSNLSLAVFAADGTTLLSLANNAAVGEVESVMDLALSNSGTYFIRVTGSTANVQLYQLHLSATAHSPNLPGDHNLDGVVDAADYVLWRKGLGTTFTQDDYNTWRTHFGQTDATGSSAHPNSAVPESATLILSLGAMFLTCGRIRRGPNAAIWNSEVPMIVATQHLLRRLK
jgi:hypothetical protein